MKLIHIIGSVILLMFFSPFSGCNSQEANPKKNVDTIIKDIPPYLNDKESRGYFAKDLAMLDIKSIENGYKDLQIRLWIGHGYGTKDSSQLIVIKKTAKKTIGELYTYKYPYESIEDSVLITNKRINALAPKSGWEVFIDSIGKLGIHELTDYKKLPGYYLAGDSFGVMVEIATNKKYRIYYYPDYEGYIDKIKEAGKMFKIMKLVEDEFNIKVICYAAVGVSFTNSTNKTVNSQL